MAEPIRIARSRNAVLPSGQSADIFDLIMADHRRIRRLSAALDDMVRWGGDSGWMLGPAWLRLAIDDGPDPDSTPRFLDALEDLGVAATFFVLGQEVSRYPRLGREIVERGHELAVHGWTHGRPWAPAPQRDIRDLVRATEAIYDATGQIPQWYRPPYGILTVGRLAAAARCGLRSVLWSAWGRDWTAGATAVSVLATVRRDLRGGGTVLLHDTDRTAAPGCWRSALGALPGLVRGCREAGWTVGRLAEHGQGDSHRLRSVSGSSDPNGPGITRPRPGISALRREAHRGSASSGGCPDRRRRRCRCRTGFLP